MRPAPASVLLVALGLVLAPAQAEEPGGPLVRTAADGAVRLTVELDRSSLWIDEPLQLAVRVEAPADRAIELPDLPDDLGGLVVLGQHSEEPSVGTGGTVWERVWTLQPEDVGELTLPAIAITHRRTASAAPERLEVDGMVVTVESVLPEDADLFMPKGIAPPVELRTSGLTSWLWIAATGVVALAAAGLLAFRRHRRRRGSLGSARAAHLTALDLLERLRRDRPHEVGRAEEFYVRLSGILRHYAAWRFGLHAPARTTEEFLGEARALDGQLGAHGASIATLLAESDLVKFARREPAAPGMVAALDAAREVVERSADPKVLVNETARAAAEESLRNRSSST